MVTEIIIALVGLAGKCDLNWYCHHHLCQIIVYLVFLFFSILYHLYGQLAIGCFPLCTHFNLHLIISTMLSFIYVILYFSALKKIRRTTVDEIEDDISIVEDDFLQSIQSHSIVIKIRLPSGVKKFKIKQVLNFQSINYILYSNLPCCLLSPSL